VAWAIVLTGSAWGLAWDLQKSSILAGSHLAHIGYQ